jgi:UDP-N-acetylmuramate--alanine ligase
MLLAEADESDGSFLALSPTITVVTNIDYEHMDHYGSMDAIRKTFVDFINKIPFYGTSVLCLDNEEIQTIIPRLKKRYLTYGMTSQADLRARDVRKQKMGVDFEVVYKNGSLGRIQLGMPGEHNVLNGLAAIGVGLELDLDMEVIKQGLFDLGGVSRRFQIKGEAKSILVVDDYGHHPAEIVATLKTAKDCWPDRRLVVIFQPHRYTRTHFLFDRFVLSFNEADVLILVPIYSAGEEPVAEATAERLAQGIKEHGHKDVVYCEGNEAMFSTLGHILKPGDVVMTLGAGDIYHLADELLTKLSSGDLPLVQE